MEFVNVQGQRVPVIGLGTWQLEGQECREAVEQALDIGYRHLDTAQMYGNEDEIGEVLRSTPIDRGELWVTTKISNHDHAYDDVISSTRESLRKLGTGFVDLLLIHWPVQFESIRETLDAMLRLRDDGRIRHLGVSNFPPSLFDKAADHAPLLCNQVEYHPFLSQDKVIEAARRRDAMVTAYSPLARGEVFSDESVLEEIGRAKGKTAAQVALRWLVDQDNVSAIPKSTSREHIEANIDIFDFVLSDEERARIDGLERGERIIDPPFAPDWED